MLSRRYTGRSDAADLRANWTVLKPRQRVLSQEIRLAIAEYFANEGRPKPPGPLYGQAVGRPLWMDAENESGA